MFLVVRLEEETLVSDTDVDGWLLVVLASELAQVVLCFHADLLHWIVVDTSCENLLVGPLCCSVVYR